jgi:hypothetical protein
MIFSSTSPYIVPDTLRGIFTDSKFTRFYKLMIVVKLMTSKHADKVVLLPPILSAVQTR